MPGRDLKGDYRYAYQGQEKDTETGKEAFQLRLWDSRIGRWLTTDPYGQFSSPYLGMGNNPITGIDPDGGWETSFGAAWAWLNGSHGGSIVSNKEATDPNRRYGVVQDLDGEAGFKYSYSSDGYRLNNLSDWDREVLPGVLENYEIGNGELRSRLISAQQSVFRSVARETMQETVGAAYRAGAEYGLLGSGLYRMPNTLQKIPGILENTVDLAGAYSVAQRGVEIKNLERLGQLQKIEPGEWIKVYDATILNGERVEVHYFLHKVTGEFLQSKIKYNSWGKIFTRGREKITGW